MPEDPRRAARGVEEAEQRADDGRLAGAVRPEEAEDLALPDVEGQVGQRSHRAVVLRQRVGADDRVRWRALHSADRRPVDGGERALRPLARYDPPMHVVVIGAGVFGTWTARWLRRRGASVTLVDQYGAGNSLSSSGDESRGHALGAWRRRALPELAAPLPRAVAARSTRRSSCGPASCGWRHRGGFEGDLRGRSSALGIPAERLEPDAMRERPRQTDRRPGLGPARAGGGGAHGSTRCGFRGAGVRRGGRRGPHRRGQAGWRASIGRWRAREADAFVFAAGPWLPKLLGPVPGLELVVPQQEVIYFATPPGDTASTPAGLRRGSSTTPRSTGCRRSRAAASRSRPTGPGRWSTPTRRTAASPTSGSRRRASTFGAGSRTWPISPWPRAASASTS